MRCRGCIVLVLLCLSACSGTPPASQKAQGAVPSTAPSPLSQAELRTTDGAIALGNLEAQIAGEERLASYGPLTVSQRAGIAELLAMRGQFLGRVADYERAEDIAEQLVRAAPTDGGAFLARAQARALFHRFGEALTDLAEAERLGLHNDRIEWLRATIFQAIGRYDEALAIRQRLGEVHADIRSLGAEASVRADRGEIAAAEDLFIKAQRAYRDVSPFPVVWLYVQQGLMWMREDNLERARALFEAAYTRLPAYAAAQGNLAEVEAALGRHERSLALLRTWMQEGSLERAWALSEAPFPATTSAEGFRAAFSASARHQFSGPPSSQLSGSTAPQHRIEAAAALGRYERAITLLRPLAHNSDDPEYAGQLARLLSEVGQAEEARYWREMAATRYDDLLARHPEAFVDHAAEFWLTAGGDPHKGLLLAEKNLGIRQTPRAYELVLQAALATQATAVACRAAEQATAAGHLWPRLRTLVSLAFAACGRPPLERAASGADTADRSGPSVAPAALP